jgi:hypothetical protein
MAIIMRARHVLVFPDNLTMDLEYAPENLREGELLSSEQLGITSEPSGKWLIRKVEEEDPGEFPHTCYYYLEKF